MKQELLVIIVDIIGSCLKVLSVHDHLYIYSSNQNNLGPDLLSEQTNQCYCRGCCWGGAGCCAAVSDSV